MERVQQDDTPSTESGMHWVLICVENENPTESKPGVAIGIDPDVIGHYATMLNPLPTLPLLPM